MRIFAFLKKTIFIFFIFLFSFYYLHTSSLRLFYDNFHCVENGKLYRSRQLSARQLENYIKKKGIKTLINLRGKNENSNWWQKEKAVAKKNGVKFYNLSMYSKALTSKKDVIKLLKIYRTAKLPILVHCLGGADRTGEACALWLLYIQKKSKKEALQQLSIKYRYLNSQSPLKRFFINSWKGEKWLKYEYDPKKLLKNFKR